MTDLESNRQNLGLSLAKPQRPQRKKNVYPNSWGAQIDGRLTAEAAEATENGIQNNHSALSAASAVNIFLSSLRSEKD